MQALVLGIRRQKGVSKKSGNAYDMIALIVANPIQDFSSDAYTKHGYGFEAAELECDPRAFEHFSKLTYPIQLDIATDNKMSFGRLVPVVVGVAKAA